MRVPDSNWHGLRPSTQKRACTSTQFPPTLGEPVLKYDLSFLEQFHKLLARSQNALRGRWENMWSSEQTCVVKLMDREAVIDKLVYTATNPVADHLVDRVHCQPGVNGLGVLLGQHRRHRRSAEPRHESIEPLHVEDDATCQHCLAIALRRSQRPRAIRQALIVLDLAPGTRDHHIVSE